MTDQLISFRFFHLPKVVFLSCLTLNLAKCQAARKTGYVGAIPNEDSLWYKVQHGIIKSGGSAGRMFGCRTIKK